MSKKTNEPTECKHEWAYKGTRYTCEPLGYKSIYSQIKDYQCKQCKATKEEARSETSRNEPMWWRH